MALKNKYPLFLLFSFIFCCTQNGSISKTININNGWGKDQELTFSFENRKDSNLPPPIFIVRNDNQYPFRNLYLLTKITSPDQTIRYDTIEYKMAQLDGKWLGAGTGKVKESLLLLPENISFSQKGNYILSVRHGMRKDTLFGIKSVGIEVKP